MTEIEMRRLGKNLNIIMCDKKISNSELAKQEGYTEAFISYVRAGTKKRSLALFVKISNVLGVSMDELVKGDF